MTRAGLAPAKINLFLHVTGRRPDGYHLLDSLAVFAGAADRLEVAPDDALLLEITGAFAPALSVQPDNLVLRAARALRDAAGVTLGARLVLEKNLPVASGIGGGSADAAAALRLLNTLWRLDLPPAELARIGVTLGADVPVCLASAPARMGGIGEMLSPAPALPAYHLVLVNPGIAVPTAQVFAARAGGFTPPARLPAAWPDAAAMAADLAALRNDLQAPATALFPVIGTVLHALAAQPDCLLARMSGSGATCFGLFATRAAAAAAANHIARLGWWVLGG